MKYRMKMTFLWLAPILLLSACAGGTAASPGVPDPTPSAKPWEPVWSTEAVYSRTITDLKTGDEQLTVKYRLPGVTNGPVPAPWAAVCEYYMDEGNRLIRTVANISAAAQEGYHLCMENGFEYYPYADEEDYEFKLNTDRYLSVLRTHYSYLGGAHGEVFLLSDTFDMEEGTPITLDQVFTVSSDVYLPRVLEQVKSQAKERFTDNGTSLLDETALDDTFDPVCFYLTPDELVVYYQVYSLGSHALGAPEFSIPRKALEDILILW